MQRSKITRLALAAIFLMVAAFCVRSFVTPIGVYYEKIANSGRPVVQAVEDYRSVHGLFPMEMSDLVPNFLSTPPKQTWLLNPGEVFCYPRRGPRAVISYRFDGPAGWWSWFEGRAGWWVASVRINRQLDVPGPIPRFTLTGEALFVAQQAEYEKRITRNPGEELFYLDKITFLALANRHESLREECERAARIFPRWWFPEMVLAEIHPSGSGASSRFAQWANNHPSFGNFWHLARHQRNRGEISQAMATLEKATHCPFEEHPKNSDWGGAALAFDATRFAYDNKNFDLVQKLCLQWKSLGPSYGEKSWLAFQAAAEIAQGQFQSAIEHAKQAIKAEQSMWAENLQDLLQAAEKHDSNFVYRAGGAIKINDWTLFSQPRP